MTMFIVGAGGHGRVVAEAAAETGVCDVAFLDDRFPDVASCQGFPVLGSLASQAGLLVPGDRVCLAVGNNRKRAEIAEVYEDLPYASVIHPRAVISRTVCLGRGTAILASAVVNANANIGSHVILNTACIIEHDCVISDAAHVSPGAILAGGVFVGARSWIGAGAVVRQGITIGCDVIIGAGAVVVSDIADRTTVVGVPAKPRAHKC